MYVSIVSNSIWEMVCFLREDVFFRLGGDVGGGETIAFEILGASLICFLLIAIIVLGRILLLHAMWDWIGALECK